MHYYSSLAVTDFNILGKCQIHGSLVTQKFGYEVCPKGLLLWSSTDCPLLLYDPWESCQANQMNNSYNKLEYIIFTKKV